MGTLRFIRKIRICGVSSAVINNTKLHAYQFELRLLFVHGGMASLVFRQKIGQIANTAPT
jgi:hypothetical protein